MKPFHLIALTIVLAATPVLAADMLVTQKNKAFSASAIAARLGQTIYFMNSDDVNHNITVRYTKEDETDDLGLQKPGEGVSYKFKSAGIYRVICSIHPHMKLVVTVQ